MKKILLSLCICLAACLGVSAQEGRMAAGLNLGAAPCLESGASLTNFGFGAKFQYNVTDPIRVEGNLNYWLKDKGADVLDITVNAHYLIPVTDKIKVYPLVGIGYAHLGPSGYEFSDDYWEDFLPYASYDDDDYDADVNSGCNKFVCNIGAGVEYALTQQLTIGLEAKYQYIKDFNRLPICLGLTYRF